MSESVGAQTETYQPLPTDELLPRTMFCEAVHDDYEHFRVVLRGPSPSDRVVRILFDSVIAYRNINESFRLRTLEQIRGMELPPLVTVENSHWLAWLRHESGGVLDGVALVHYMIITPEDIIEIASEFPPRVEHLN